MLDLCKKATVCGFLLLTGNVLASTETLTFENVVDGGSNFNEFVLEYDSNGTTQTVSVSAWSDTADAQYSDPYIREAADIDKFLGGWSIVNQDETKTNCGYGHSADNFNCYGSWTDYDFFLLEFSEEVTLDQATFSWINGIDVNNYQNTYENGEKVGVITNGTYTPDEHDYYDITHQQAVEQNEVSFVALNNGTDVNGNTFDNIKNNQMIDSGSSEVMTDYVFSNGKALTSSTGYYADVGFTASSTTWIVSAFNSMFGTEAGMSEGDDGFKLSGISFSTPVSKPPADIPEPSTFLIMLGALGLLSRRSSLQS